METKKCKHIYCDVEFAMSRKDRKYCSKECRAKANKIRRYNKDEDYVTKQSNSSMKSYNKKKANWVKPLDLTIEQLKNLEKICPEKINWENIRFEFSEDTIDKIEMDFKLGNADDVGITKMYFTSDIDSSTGGEWFAFGDDGTQKKIEDREKIIDDLLDGSN